MKREIKFRVWDSRNKKMITNDVCYSLILGLNGTIKAVTDDVLMQFTGLTDKNGKEIYEGDVLKPTIECGKKLGKIVWLENRSAFGIHWYLQLGTGDIEFCVNDMKMEIVGNIYKNPELL